jgi:hypothetical protein
VHKHDDKRIFSFGLPGPRDPRGDVSFVNRDHVDRRKLISGVYVVGNKRSIQSSRPLKVLNCPDDPDE